jgi:hypothetical protein
VKTPSRIVRMRLLLCGLTMVMLSGCGAAQAPVARPPNLEQVAFNVLYEGASYELQCPAKQITYEQFAGGRHLFRGCGAQSELVVVHDQNYGGIRPMPAAANRFSKEVPCDLAASHEEEIDKITRVVDGCGKRITYVYSCSSSCTWVANTRAEGEQKADVSAK